MNLGKSGLPVKQGLYDPRFEHDACGIGFIVRINGEKSHDIVSDAINILERLEHRGGAGSENNTGDGAGILLQIPDKFLRRVCPTIGIKLPAAGEYGVGMVFLSRNAATREKTQRLIERIVREEGQTVLGWRMMPVNESALGSIAKSNRPAIRQLIIGRSPDIKDTTAFERKLFVIRRRCEILSSETSASNGGYFYFASLSSRTIVYKGMLTARQVDGFYLDLQDFDFETSLALVHSRYSTNTFPSWERAHPYRYLIHNGEINTLRGNVNWMKARESSLSDKQFGPDIEKIKPLLMEDGSDSAIFDNCLEFLSLSGRSLPHAIMMMVPEPWENNENMNDSLKAFYEYHSTLMEPWDGPAAMAFTDGVQVGAILDRNGLRPSRYTVTTDGLVILSSEAGVLGIAPERIQRLDRLRPGRMLLIDTAAGKIIENDELKQSMADEHPYRTWLEQNLTDLDDVAAATTSCERSPLSLEQQQKAFGYSFEDVKTVILPMAAEGVEPTGAMGTDTPLAILSDRPQMLYSYFKQLFAQVTNPPIDATLESIVTMTNTTIGSDGVLNDPQPENCRLIRIHYPIMTNDELRKLQTINQPGYAATTLPILFPAGGNGDALKAALDDLFAKADAAIADGRNILILSDRGISESQAAIPALLAVAGLHHHLIRKKTRTHVSLLLESGEPREVHHFAMLIGYGVSAINPYLAFDVIHDAITGGRLNGIDPAKACENYIKAAVKGVIKVISKMGISTIQSYQGSQIFEAVGIGHVVIDRYFTATASRIGGIGLPEIADTSGDRWAAAFADPAIDPGLPTGGHYNWRSDGEYHQFNPMTVHLLQQSTRNGDYKLFQEYSKLLNDETQRLCTLRGLLGLVPAEQPLAIDEVESVEDIVRRFKTGAMSYGSISKEAHEALAIAMNRLGGRSNTGEGGEDPERFDPLPNGDSKCSAIKQVASGRFGVTSHYLVNSNEIQIKMAQGAKPGEGGQLPGRKVYPWIAKTRHATTGVGLISPPPHHDIYSIEDLAELIFDLKNANNKARISVKLVSEVGIGTIAAGVAKGRADVVLVSGYDGGTGASPRTSIRHAGLPWELGLAETHQTLILNNLRSRITVETDGKLLTGRDVAIAALLGAEEYGFATGPLITLGCVMMRVCNLDTCPVGVATQNSELRARFTGKPEYVENFMRFVAQELREIMAEMGFRTINEMVGRTDRLNHERLDRNPKLAGLDLSPLLYQPELPAGTGRICTKKQDHNLGASLDQKILFPICRPVFETGQQIRATLPISNIDRAAGTQLGSEISRRYGAEGLPDGTIELTFKGSAGQSFGAFIPSGMTLRLEGDANDYVGKGLSGGRIVVVPAEAATFNPDENIIIGNTALYGATSGECFVYGIAGERFCVRNSGARVVVEGVGDHGCEYMTGGRAVILGPTGRNFAAGMSGGVAYVLDEDGRFREHCNSGMVDICDLTAPHDEEEVLELIRKHQAATGSAKAADLLANWSQSKARMVKVMPKDYRKMLQLIVDAEAAGLTGENAILAAFEASTRLAAGTNGK